MQLNIIIFIDIYTDKLYGGDGWNQLPDRCRKKVSGSHPRSRGWLEYFDYFAKICAFPVA